MEINHQIIHLYVEHHLHQVNNDQSIKTNGSMATILKNNNNQCPEQLPPKQKQSDESFSTSTTT